VITLAIESSTEIASLALFRGDGVIASERRPEPGRSNRPLFDALDAVLVRGGVRAAEIDRFVVGRGPGRYSGLRAALTLARFLALPGDRPVWAVSSGAALAAATLRERGAPAVAVLGDARRGQYWLGIFRPEGSGPPRMEAEWAALPPDALTSAVPADAILVSPEFTHLRAQGLAARLGIGRWIAEDRGPDAVEVGALALAAERAGVPSEPLTPLYLHPPVSAGPAEMGGRAAPGPRRGLETRTAME